MKHAAMICLTVVAVLAMTATGAMGQLSEDFDSYPAGSQIVNQPHWLKWANDPTDPNNGGALVSSAYSSSGANSLQMSGVNSVPGLNSDVCWQFGPITSGVATVTANVYIPENALLGKQAIPILARHPGDGTYDPPNGIDWISNGYEFDLVTGMVTSPDATAIPFVRNAWKQIKIVADVDNLKYSTYYDGIPLTVDGTWDGPNQIEALDFWSDNSGLGCSPIYVDDLNAVPEPTSLVMLLGFGFGALFVYRRHRR